LQRNQGRVDLKQMKCLELKGKEGKRVTPVEEDESETAKERIQRTTLLDLLITSRRNSDQLMKFNGKL